MSHSTFHNPDFDIEQFRTEVARWAKVKAVRLFIEWSTGPGPTVVYYPSGDRSVAVTWHLKVNSSKYNEQYADFLEYRLMPRLKEIGQGLSLDTRILCADQQPIQVMRQRRREIDNAQLVTSSH